MDIGDEIEVYRITLIDKNTGEISGYYTFQGVFAYECEWCCRKVYEARVAKGCLLVDPRNFDPLFEKITLKRIG
jgi:hypothetical protein